MPLGSPKAEETTTAYELLERAGFVRASGSAGIHSLLPLGWRVYDKICRVIYEEMEAAGVLNLQLPILQNRELWEPTSVR